MIYVLSLQERKAFCVLANTTRHPSSDTRRQRMPLEDYGPGNWN